MQHRRLIVWRHAVNDTVHRVRHVRVAVAIDGHVVREILRARRAECGAEVDHREAFARRQVVDAELRLPGAHHPERGAIGVGDEQPIARLIGFDTDRRHELRVANERHDAAVALDLEDRAFGERARQEAAIGLVVLDAFGDEAAALDRDDRRPSARRAARSAAASRSAIRARARSPLRVRRTPQPRTKSLDAWRHLRRRECAAS